MIGKQPQEQLYMHLIQPKQLKQTTYKYIYNTNYNNNNNNKRQLNKYKANMLKAFSEQI